MKINVKSQNMDMTLAISDYLNKRLNHVKKFMGITDDAAIVYVEVGKTSKHHKQGDYFQAEAHLHAWGKEFSATSKQSDLYSAIDEMKDELTREVKEYKNKKTDTARKGDRKIKSLLLEVRGDKEKETIE
ncbi:MAG: ribosome-associated translation inhibitor RaiA [Candidatus Vogelbacteria bacterium]|nr:ribosome-associated translation inhibitor RaiA [Candidatus Vogelbacteria bacterium]